MAEAEHHCAYREVAEEQRQALAELRAEMERERAARQKLEAELAQFKKTVLGPKSERMPSPSESLKKGKAPDPEKTAAKSGT